ncbi:MAG: iron ABC transporter permease [Candidatus Promineifilaceae bacterium]
MAVNELSPIRTWLKRQTNVMPDGRRSGRWSVGYVTLLGGALFVSALILLIPLYLVIRAGSAWAEVAQTLRQPITLQVLGNTILLAVSVVVATTVIAVLLAWLVSCTDLPGKKVWTILAALPLVIPSYVAAFLYISILSPKGLLQQALYPWLGIERLPNFYGFPGAFLVLTCISYPFTFLTVRVALQRMDPALVEAARSLGLSPWCAFWRVTLPYLRPSMVAGGLLVLLYCLRDFGAVTMLQYSTFTRVIFNRYLAYRLDAATALALALVALTAVILLLEQRTRGRARYERLGVGAARAARLTPLGRWKWPALLLVGGVVFWSLLLPASALLYWLGRGLFQDWLVAGSGGAPRNVVTLAALVGPAWNSFAVSLSGAALTMILALPVAVLVVRRASRLTRLFERLTYASSALPGIVVALAYVFWSTNYALPLYQKMPVLLLAYVILFIPQAVGAQRASLLQLPASLEEAGQSLGKSPLTVFRQITWPLIRPGILAGGALVFLTCMKELPATLILSPLGFNTLAMQVWTNVEEAFFARAAAAALLLLLLSSVPLAWLTMRDKSA